MKSLLQRAKKFMGEKNEIYPEKVKQAVEVAAKAKREEIRRLLQGKLLSFTVDMATCRHRSFIGK